MIDLERFLYKKEEDAKKRIKQARRIVGNCRLVKKLKGMPLGNIGKGQEDLGGNPIYEKLEGLTRFAYAGDLTGDSWGRNAYFVSLWVERAKNRFYNRKMTEREYKFLFESSIEGLYKKAVLVTKKSNYAYTARFQEDKSILFEPKPKARKMEIELIVGPRYP